ncbi:hypothetical protein CAMRE0001_0804 [Campylobacter rectus RM3267]|uniref:Uncharacterized protein n=2 Tax=Campylobacter rectus TaxID=203 RepID=A0A6G5QKI0_CAMRE|nr:hypothetical protein CAMRE0001_0804 [Campylobacter rectus RM3267]QCD46087.1 hypothetical protein CRECT_0391 [Campylobacter rectus]
MLGVRCIFVACYFIASRANLSNSGALYAVCSVKSNSNFSKIYVKFSHISLKS